MAKPEVTRADGLASWINKQNQIGSNLGDADTLTSQLHGQNNLSDGISAVNNRIGNFTAGLRPGLNPTYTGTTANPNLADTLESLRDGVTRVKPTLGQVMAMDFNPLQLIGGNDLDSV